MWQSYHRTSSAAAVAADAAADDDAIAAGAVANFFGEHISYLLLAPSQSSSN